MTPPARGQRLVDDARGNGYDVEVRTTTDQYKVWVNSPDSDNEQVFHVIWERNPVSGRWRMTWIDDGGETAESRLSLDFVRFHLGLKP